MASEKESISNLIEEIQKANIAANDGSVDPTFSSAQMNDAEYFDGSAIRQYLYYIKENTKRIVDQVSVITDILSKNESLIEKGMIGDGGNITEIATGTSGDNKKKKLISSSSDSNITSSSSLKDDKEVDPRYPEGLANIIRERLTINFRNMMSSFGDMLSQKFRGLMDMITQPIRAIGDKITSGIRALGEKMVNGIRFIGDKMVSGVKFIGSKIYDGIKFVANGIKNIASGLWTGIKALSRGILKVSTFVGKQAIKLLFGDKSEKVNEDIKENVKIIKDGIESSFGTDEQKGIATSYLREILYRLNEIYIRLSKSSFFRGIINALNPMTYIRGFVDKIKGIGQSITSGFSSLKKSFTSAFSSPQGLIGGLIFGIKSVTSSILSGIFGKGKEEIRHEELVEAIQEGNEPNTDIAYTAKEIMRMLVDFIADETTSAKLSTGKKTLKEQKRTRVGVMRVHRRIRQLIDFFTGGNLRTLLSESLGNMFEDLQNSFRRGFEDFKRGLSRRIDAVKHSLRFINPKFYLNKISEGISSLKGALKYLNPGFYIGKIGGFLKVAFGKLSAGLAGFFGGIAGWFGGKRKINREFLNEQLEPIRQSLLNMISSLDKIYRKTTSSVNYLRKLFNNSEKMASYEQNRLKEKEDVREQRNVEKTRHEELIDAIKKDVQEKREAKKGGGIFGFLTGTLGPMLKSIVTGIAGLTSALGMKKLAERLRNLGEKIPDGKGKAGARTSKMGKMGKMLGGKAIVGIAGLGALEMAKGATEDIFMRNMKNEDVGMSEYLGTIGTATAGGMATGYSIGSLVGRPKIGAAIGGILGFGTSSAALGISALTPSQKEAEEKSRLAWEEQRNKEAIERMRESGVLNYNWIGKSKIDRSKLDSLSIRELKALIDLDDFNDEDLELINQALVEKRARQEEIKKQSEKRTEESLEEFEEQHYRDKLDQLIKQREQTVAALEQAGAPQQQIDLFKKDIDAKIAQYKEMPWYKKATEDVYFTGQDAVNAVKEGASNIMDMSRSVVPAVKEGASDVIDMGRSVVPNIGEGASNIMDMGKGLMERGISNIKEIDTTRLLPLKQYTQTQTQVLKEAANDMVSKVLNEVSATMSNVNNQVSNASSTNISISSPSTILNNMNKGNLYRNVKSAISMNN